MTRFNPEKFQLVPNALGTPLLMNELEVNLKMWLDWAFLAKSGAWFNVTYVPGGGSNTTYPKATTPWQLRAVSDRAFADYRVYEGFRKDWVWEQGVNYVSPVDDATYNPLVPVVYVDGVLVSSSLYSIDYSLGRVIFNSAQSATADVEAQYSFRWVQIYTMAEAHWFRELQFASFQGDNTDFLQADATGGSWSVNGQHRIQMPCIVLEAAPRGFARGFELGSQALANFQDVICHVIAEDSFTRNQLLDTLRYQRDKVIWLFSSNLVSQGDAWPLQPNGDLANSNVYPDLIAEGGGYRWDKCTFTDVVLEDVAAIHPNLYEGVVRITTEVLTGQI